MKFNLRNICKLANRLAKEVKRSDAFKQAWRASKFGILEKVVGVTHSNRQNLLYQLDQCRKIDIQVHLEHEFNNPFDDNAVAVMVNVVGLQYRMHMGYIERRTASIWANLLDQGVKFATVMQSIVGGNYGQSYGMRIKIQV